MIDIKERKSKVTRNNALGSQLAVALCLVGLLPLFAPQQAVANIYKMKLRKVPDRKELMESEICKKAFAPIDMGFLAKEEPEFSKELEGEFKRYKGLWQRFCKGEYDPKDKWERRYLINRISPPTSSMMRRMYKDHYGHFEDLIFAWENSDERIARLLTVEYTKFLPALHSEFRPFPKIKYDFSTNWDDFLFANRWSQIDYSLLFTARKTLNNRGYSASIQGNIWENRRCLHLNRINWDAPLDQLHKLKELSGSWDNYIDYWFFGSMEDIFQYGIKKDSICICGVKKKEVIPILKRLLTWEKYITEPSGEINFLKKVVSKLENGEMKIILQTPYTKMDL